MTETIVTGYRTVFRVPPIIQHYPIESFMLLLVTTTITPWIISRMIHRKPKRPTHTRPNPAAIQALDELIKKNN